LPHLPSLPTPLRLKQSSQRAITWRWTSPRSPPLQSVLVSQHRLAGMNTTASIELASTTIATSDPTHGALVSMTRTSGSRFTSAANVNSSQRLPLRVVVNTINGLQSSTLCALKTVRPGLRLVTSKATRTLKQSSITNLRNPNGAEL